MTTTKNNQACQLSEMAAGGHHSRSMVGKRMWTLAFFLLLVLFDQCHGAAATKGKKCQQYGHSCLGGHGKRSSPPMMNAAAAERFRAAADNADDMLPNLSFRTPTTTSVLKNDDEEKNFGNDLDETLDEQIKKLIKYSRQQQPLVKGAFRRHNNNNNNIGQQQQQKQLKQQMLSEEGENQSVIQLDFDALGANDDNNNNNNNNMGNKGSAWSLLIVPFRRTSSPLHKALPVGQLISGENTPLYSQ